MVVLILDYGSGNIKSVFNSVKKALNLTLNYDVKVSSNFKDIEISDKIILPGVGSFDQCMKLLKKLDGIFETLHQEVINKKKPFLGICVGMQILADFGYENVKTRGLSWIDGDVKSLKNYIKTKKELKIPHMGWNNLDIENNIPILGDISYSDQFYFVHSFFLM